MQMYNTHIKVAGAMEKQSNAIKTVCLLLQMLKNEELSPESVISTALSLPILNAPM